MGKWLEKTLFRPRREPSIWTHRNFLLLFFTGALIGVGSKLYELTLPILLYEFTRSSVVMGTMRAVEFLPNLLLGMFIGVIVDRMNKKRLMLWSIAVQGALLAVLYATVKLGYLSVALFYLTGFVMMTFSFTFFTVRNAVVKLSMPAELYTPANAQFTFIAKLIAIMGPAISSLVFLLSDLEDALLLTSAMMLLGLFVSAGLKVSEARDGKPGQTPSSFWAEWKEGWREFARNRALWYITWVVVVTNAAEGMVQAMVIFFAKDELRLESSVLGLVLAAGGVGGLIGSSLVTRLRKKVPIGRLMGIMILLLGLSYLVLCGAFHAVLVAVSLLLSGTFATVFSICVWTFRLETTAAHLIGRVNGITGSLFKLGVPLSMFGSGWISEWIGVSYVFAGAALLNIGLFLAYLRSPLWSGKPLTVSRQT